MANYYPRAEINNYYRQRRQDQPPSSSSHVGSPTQAQGAVSSTSSIAASSSETPNAGAKSIAGTRTTPAAAPKPSEPLANGEVGQPKQATTVAIAAAPGGPAVVTPLSSVITVSFLVPVSKTTVVALGPATSGKWTATFFAPNPNGQNPTLTAIEQLIFATVPPDAKAIHTPITPIGGLFNGTTINKFPQVFLDIQASQPRTDATATATTGSGPAETSSSTPATGTSSTTSTVAPATSTGAHKSGHLSGGAIAGIVIALLLLLAGGIVVFMVYTRRWGKKRPRSKLLGVMNRRGENYEDNPAQMEQQVVGVLPAGSIQKQMIFDQPKDNDAIKSLFESADDMLADHIENYYVPQGEVDASQQLQQIPREDYDLIESNRVLNRRSVLLQQGNTRGYALRALAAYYLYDAVMDDKFLPGRLKQEVEKLKSDRQGYNTSRQDLEESRRILFHRFAQSGEYTSAMEATVAYMTRRLDQVLSPFANDHDPERNANLQNVVRRFAELAITLKKQPAVYKAELCMRDFSNIEVPKEEKKGREAVVRYMRWAFDGSRMEVENRGADLNNGKVRAVVAPAVRKYTPESGLKFDHSELIRKARVVILSSAN